MSSDKCLHFRPVGVPFVLVIDIDAKFDVKLPDIEYCVQFDSSDFLCKYLDEFGGKNGWTDPFGHVIAKWHFCWPTLAVEPKIKRPFPRCRAVYLPVKYRKCRRLLLTLLAAYFMSLIKCNRNMAAFGIFGFGFVPLKNIIESIWRARAKNWYLTNGQRGVCATWMCTAYVNYSAKALYLYFWNTKSSRGSRLFSKAVYNYIASRWLVLLMFGCGYILVSRPVLIAVFVLYSVISCACKTYFNLSCLRISVSLCLQLW